MNHCLNSLIHSFQVWPTTQTLPCCDAVQKRSQSLLHRVSGVSELLLPLRCQSDGKMSIQSATAQLKYATPVVHRVRAIYVCTTLRVVFCAVVNVVVLFRIYIQSFVRFLFPGAVCAMVFRMLGELVVLA